MKNNLLYAMLLTGLICFEDSNKIKEYPSIRHAETPPGQPWIIIAPRCQPDFL
jgi:hypothetical protein